MAWHNNYYDDEVYPRTLGRMEKGKAGFEFYYDAEKRGSDKGAVTITLEVILPSFAGDRRRHGGSCQDDGRNTNRRRVLMSDSKQQCFH